MSDEEGAARSLAMVGAIGLVSLPLLLTASPLVNAPLGAPAAIALGYLAAAWLLRFGKNGGAAAWILAVHCALVLWTIIYAAVTAGTLSWAGLTAVLLAPAFAAAPAVVRRALPPVDRQAPAPTPTDRVERSPQNVEKSLSPELADGSKAAAELVSSPASSKQSSDLGGAIAFALRRAEPGMRAKDICLLRQQSSSLAVSCDPRLCRQIVTSLIAWAATACPVGATVKVEARSLKGAVLFRITLEDPEQRDDMLDRLSASLARTQLLSLVDEAEGTLLTGRAGQGGASVTLRLASAPEASAECPAKSLGGA